MIIDFDRIDPEELPEESAIAAVTLAELACGPHATDDPVERSRRQDRLQRVERSLVPLPFDEESARAYARIYALVLAQGRKTRGARALDLMIAATAAGVGLPLYTRNPDDFAGLGEVVEVVAVR